MLPSSVRVIVRDWLNANHIVLTGTRAWRRHAQPSSASRIFRCAWSSRVTDNRLPTWARHWSKENGRIVECARTQNA